MSSFLSIVHLLRVIALIAFTIICLPACGLFSAQNADDGSIQFVTDGADDVLTEPLAALSITRITPNAADPGDTITIEGSGFLSSDPVRVYLNDLRALVVQASKASVQIIVPAQHELLISQVDVRVERAEESQTVNTAFTYNDNVDCQNGGPVVIALDPLVAYEGRDVKVIGANFSSQTIFSIANKQITPAAVESNFAVIFMPNFDEFCTDVDEGCLFDMQVTDNLGCTSTKRDALLYQQPSNDIDGDGVPNDEDCQPDNPDVYPGAPDELDGKDSNCEWDQVRCLPQNIPVECIGYDLGIAISSEPASYYCARIDLTPGNDADPFTGASYDLEIRRVKETTHQFAFPWFLYEFHAAQELNNDCGPIASILPDITAPMDEQRFYSADISEPVEVCDFEVPTIDDDVIHNFVKVEVEQGLQHRLRVRMNAINFVEADLTCEFGD